MSTACKARRAKLILSFNFALNAWTNPSAFGAVSPDFSWYFLSPDKILLS
jgi:hypothetical protein